MNRADLDPAQAVLLAICANPEADHATRLAALDTYGWDKLASLAQEQRVETLLGLAIRNAGTHAGAPGTLSAALRAEHRRLSLYHLSQLASLGRITALLAREGIEAIALKGMRMIACCYPDPALRPMRDIDLLVPRADAERAQALLLAEPQFTTIAGARTYGVEHNHQLPEVVDTTHDVVIEVHHRLNSIGFAADPKLVERIFAERERVEVGGLTVQVPSAHANLLHLVEHATLHHLFDNGPRILADLHFAAREGAIDWPRFIAEAAELGLLPSLRLVAAVALAHGADWVPDRLREESVAPAFVAEAEVALLRTRSEREGAAFLRRMHQRSDSRTGWRAALHAAVRPDPVMLAQIAGTRPDSARRWLAYPAWLVRRAMKYLSTRSGSATAERQGALLAWLKGES